MGIQMPISSHSATEYGPLTDSARPDRASLAGCQRLQRHQRQIRKTRQVQEQATRTGAAAAEPSLGLAPHICNAPVSLNNAAASAAAAAASRASATCHGNISDWVRSSSSGGRKRATVGDEDESLQLVLLQPCDLARGLQRLWPGRCGKLPSDCSVAPRALLVLV